jgi:hypothetical protein
MGIQYEDELVAEALMIADGSLASLEKIILFADLIFQDDLCMFGSIAKIFLQCKSSAKTISIRIYMSDNPDIVVPIECCFKNLT